MTPAAIPPHGYLRRRSLPSITAPMRDALVRLRSNEGIFVALPDVDPRTIRALEDRDWIVSSLSCTVHMITAPGLRALKVYEPIVKRSDGLCPRCCERPRAIRSTGEPAPYCRECTRQLSKRTYQLGMYRLRPLGACARCEKRPRFVASSGKVYSYCKHCKNLLHRREHKRQRAELHKRVLAGEHVACSRAGCDQPRYVTGKSVQDYCRPHFREYQNGYYHRAVKPRVTKEAR